MRESRPREKRQLKRYKGPTAQAGGAIVVKDFGDNLEAALKEFKRTAAANMAEARRRQTFMAVPTRGARKRRGKRLEIRRVALGLERRF